MARRGRVQGRVGTWPPGEGAAVRPPPIARRGDIRDLIAALAVRCRDWARADVAPGRLLPWLPVAFGFGIALYFTAEREPAWWVAGGCAGLAAIAAVLVRRRPIAFPVVLGIAALAAGFATATLKSVRSAHPILQRTAYSVSLAGFVETREERERSDRIVVRVARIDSTRSDGDLERVRLSVKKGLAPAVGSFVELKARLNPPMTPLRPGGYDFARDLYFQRIGAIGFATGAIKIATPTAQPDAWLRASTVVEGIRDAIDQRIRSAIPGDNGSIASALITGKRDAISAPVNDAMYVSSLAHVLSISGYHMAVVAGVVFFVVRALLALWPALAMRHAIKKWAALAALVAATLYLILSGAEIATRRAYIMTAIVLVGVMADRPALTLRNLALAAIAVLLVAPEAVVHPSFQMSFAATLALVATWERGLPWVAASPDTGLGARLALWGVREMVALVLASLVAGLATTPYAAYHFHRTAPYGVLANLLAMPIVSAWVMPSGLLALVALPFGFDAPLWRLMGMGIEWMTGIALWVASLPGAVGRVAAFGTGPLLLGTAGLLLVCLLRSPLRWSGGLLIAFAVVSTLRTPLPDVLVAAAGDAVAVRTANGRLAIARAGNDQFVAREWLAADGDARSPADKALADGFSCDDGGCVARLGDGTLVSFAHTPEAIAEDCGLAALVVTRREQPPACAATGIDRNAWRPHGAMALRRVPGGWDIEAARPAGYDRPWARAVERAGKAPSAGTTAQGTASTAATSSGTTSTGATSVPAQPRGGGRDAQPKPEDLDAGD